MLLRIAQRADPERFQKVSRRRIRRADPLNLRRKLGACLHRGVRELGLSALAETDCMALTENRSKTLIGATITVKVNPIRTNGSTASASLVGQRPRKRAFQVTGEVMTD